MTQCGKGRIPGLPPEMPPLAPAIAPPTAPATAPRHLSLKSLKPNEYQIKTKDTSVDTCYCYCSCFYCYCSPIVPAPSHQMLKHTLKTKLETTSNWKWLHRHLLLLSPILLHCDLQMCFFLSQTWFTSKHYEHNAWWSGFDATLPCCPPALSPKDHTAGKYFPQSVELDKSLF